MVEMNKMAPSVLSAAADDSVDECGLKSGHGAHIDPASGQARAESVVAWKDE
jgi:hypothetical protein